MHPDEDFLRDYLKDVREEMKWRRDFEFRLVQLLLVFYPIVGTIMVTLFQIAISPLAYLMLSIGVIVFIVTTSSFITHRIVFEHRAYADLGRIVQKIWSHFGLFEPGAYLKSEKILPEKLRDPDEGFGQGQGHKRTLTLVWIITITLIILMLALGILKGP